MAPLKCLDILLIGVLLSVIKLSTEQVHPLDSRNERQVARRVDPAWEEIFHHHVTLTSYRLLPEFTNGTVPQQIIVSNCTAFISFYGDVVADYSRCAVTHSRPVKFCERCVDEFVLCRQVHNELMQDNLLDKDGVLCSKVINDSDRVGIIEETRRYVQGLWDESDCENCFDAFNGTYHLKSDTQHFMNLADETNECFSNFSNSMPGDVDSQLGASNGSVCTNCKELYVDLNKFYSKLEDKWGEDVCIDVADTMNQTRHKWSIKFGCGQKKEETIEVIVMTGAFALLPLIFYSANIVCHKRQKQFLLKQKRLTENNSAQYGSLS